mmetsp:Transcript_5549/g.5707  ORF Transcript_5549/g.5707 Transcript_5549/m.5707 type:complete len:279 (+) Transcript_5549:115-951(+)
MNFIETLTPEDTLTFLTIEKPFIDLCTKQNASQNRLAAVERNYKRCSDENDNIDDEIKNTREVSFKAKEKLNRISSLCSDLRKRLEVSATQKAIEDERTKRMELNDTFALEVQNVSKRIEDVATNKQINSQANDSLRLQLTISIDNFHTAENPEIQESSFEIESMKSVSNMLQSTELSQMDYEDYLGHVSASILRQFHLREELSSYNNKFQAFQNRLAENNEVFERHRRKIDEVSEIAKKKHVFRSEINLETKILNKSIKLESALYLECQKNLEKEKK